MLCTDFKVRIGPDSYIWGFAMRVRSILLSTALVLSTAGVSHAIAAATTLKPQGKWAVTKVAAKSASSAPYCALARRYGNGSVVTFARNENNETSVAVDFPPKSFKPSQNYTVVLDPGAGETRSYKTQPISERGIVIRMGKDEKFYSALEKTGKLGIAVDDLSYTYSMSDLKSGTQDLAACLGTAVEPAAGDSASEAPPLPMNRNKSKTEQMVDATLPARVAPAPGSLAVGSSSDENESLKEENIRLRNALERERRTYEDKMQQSNGSSNAAELTEKIQLLQSENVKLKDKLTSAVPMAAVGGATAVGKVSSAAAVPAAASCAKNDSAADVTALKAENGKLKSDLEAAQKLASAQPAVKADDKITAALRAENSQLKADLDIAKKNVAQLEIGARTFVDRTPAVRDRGEPALVKMLKDQVAQLESENSKLKLAAGSKSSGPASSDDMKLSVAGVAKAHALEEQLKMMTADRDRLSSQIQAMKMMPTSGPNAKLSSDNWNLEQATQRYNEAEREIQRLGNAVESERAKCIVEKKNIEYMLFDPKIATKEQIAKLMTLENQLVEAKQGMDVSKDKSIKELQARLADAQKVADESGGKVAANDKAVSDLKLQLAQVQKDLNAAKMDKVATNDAAITDLKTQLTSANGQVAVLQKSLEDVKTQKVAADSQAVADLKMQLASANNQTAQLQKEIADAKTQTLAANDKTVNDLKLQLTASNDQVAQLKKSLDDAQRQQTASAEQSAVVNSLKQEIVSLNNQMSNMQAEKTAAAAAARVAGMAPAAGGSASVSRLSARPETVVPAVQVDTDGLPAVTQPVSMAPVTAQALATPPVPMVAPIVAAPVESIASIAQLGNGASNSKLIGVQDVKTLLSQAGVKVTSDVTPVPNGASAGKVSYRWKSDGLFGTIEQKTMEGAGQYDRYVQDYIDKTKSRCKGQFAAVPGMVNMNGGTRISSYEIACVDDKSGDGASASLAFYSQNGTFTTVAHEASSDSMDVAMDARDKIVMALDGAKTASK